MKIYSRFIEALNKKIPKTITPSMFITDFLEISYDAALRRLNGKVKFTLDEIVVLARKLEISLDDLVGVQVEDKAPFKLHLLAQKELSQIYNDKIKDVTNEIRRTREETGTIKAYLAINKLSYSFILPHLTLTKFFLYRWLHQMGGIKGNTPMSKLLIPDNILETQKEYIREIHKINEVTIILDRNIFKFMVYNIRHFYKIGLVTEEECLLLKKDLNDLLDTMDKSAYSGKTFSGTKYNLYLSSIDIDASLICFESDTSHTSQFSVYTIYTLDSKDRIISKHQKEWLDSLKRFSIKISECEEYERAQFLLEQRELIDHMLDEVL